jgi:hypothetical protein
VLKDTDTYQGEYKVLSGLFPPVDLMIITPSIIFHNTENLNIIFMRDYQIQDPFHK